MPALSRRYLIAAATFMLLGITLGLVLLVRRELFHAWPSPFAVSAHAHLILVGAVLETIIGTALWLFPRPVGGTSRDLAPSATAGWWLLTAGTTLRAGGELARTWSAGELVRWTVVAGGVGQVAGILCGLAALRSRIRPSSRAT